MNRVKSQRQKAARLQSDEMQRRKDLRYHHKKLQQLRENEEAYAEWYERMLAANRERYHKRKQSKAEQQ